MAAIAEQLEESTSDVSPSVLEPAIQQRGDVPTPLELVIPEPNSVKASLPGNPTSVRGAPFEPHRQTRYTSDQMEFASLGQSSKPEASRLNSFRVDPRLRNGTYTPSTILCHDVNS
jgi:hypothetical protein